MNFRLRLTRLLIFPVALLALATQHRHPADALVDTLLTAGGVLLLVLAAGGRAWASIYLAGRKNDVLVTAGPYSLTRNPLYLFSFLGFIGVGLAMGSLVLAAAFAVVFLLSHWPTILAEERFLEERFGNGYDGYRASVPRFLPAIRRPASAGTIPINTAKLSLALRDCMAIPLVIIVVEIMEWAQLTGLLPILVTLP